MKQNALNWKRVLVLTALVNLSALIGGCGDEEEPPFVTTIFDNEYAVEAAGGSSSMTVAQNNSQAKITTVIYQYVDPDFRVLEVGVGSFEDTLTGKQRGIYFRIPIDLPAGQEYEFPVRAWSSEFTADRQEWVEVNYVELSDYRPWYIGQISRASGSFTVERIGSWATGTNSYVIGSFNVRIEGESTDYQNPDSDDRFFVDLACADFRLCDPE